MLQKLADFLFGPDYSDSQCIACGSEDRKVLAEDVYRCLACGYEGGDGHADYLAQKKESALEALDGPAKEERAQRLFNDAHLLIIAARGTIEHALEVDGDRGRQETGFDFTETEMEMMTAVNDIFQAQRHMQEAAKLRGVNFPPEIEAEMAELEAAFDDATGDSFGRSRAFVRKLASSRDTIGAMQTWCNVQRHGARANK